MPPAAVPLRVAFAPLVGARWAGRLCAGLLVGLALLTGWRWFGPPAGHETALQQPVDPADFPSAPSEATAPDPGDNP